MNKRFQISSIVFFLTSLIIIFRVETFLGIWKLLFENVLLLFGDFSAALKIIDIKLIDYYFSLLLLTISPILMFIFRDRLKRFQIKLNFTNFILILVAFLIIFAPIITNENPNFQKDIASI